MTDPKNITKNIRALHARLTNFSNVHIIQACISYHTACQLHTFICVLLPFHIDYNFLEVATIIMIITSNSQDFSHRVGKCIILCDRRPEGGDTPSPLQMFEK